MSNRQCYSKGHSVKTRKKDASVDTHDLVWVTDAPTQIELMITYSQGSETHKGLNNFQTEVTQPNTPNSGYNSDASTVIIPEDEYNSRLNTPTNPSTHDATVTIKSDAATVIPEDEYDSDAIRLDTPTIFDTHDVIDMDQLSDISSDGSYIETYTSDLSYTGPAYQSLLCGIPTFRRY